MTPRVSVGHGQCLGSIPDKLPSVCKGLPWLHRVAITEGKGFPFQKALWKDWIKWEQWYAVNAGGTAESPGWGEVMLPFTS